MDFDGKTDSIFHEFDNIGNKHMEYLKDYGSFIEVPYEQMIDEYDKFYPHLEVKNTMSFGGKYIKNLKDKKFEDEVIKL